MDKQMVIGVKTPSGIEERNSMKKPTKNGRVVGNPLCDRCWYPKARANQLVGFCKRCKERLTKPARKGDVDERP